MCEVGLVRVGVVLGEYVDNCNCTRIKKGKIKQKRKFNKIRIYEIIY